MTNNFPFTRAALCQQHRSTMARTPSLRSRKINIQAKFICRHVHIPALCSGAVSSPSPRPHRASSNLNPDPFPPSPPSNLYADPNPRAVTLRSPLWMLAAECVTLSQTKGLCVESPRRCSVGKRPGWVIHPQKLTFDRKCSKKSPIVTQVMSSRGSPFEPSESGLC